MSQTCSYEVAVRNSAQSVIVPLKGGISALDRVYEALVAADVDPFTGYCSSHDYIRRHIVAAFQSLQHSDRAATTCLKRLDGTLVTLTQDEGTLQRQKSATSCTLDNLRTKQKCNENLLQDSRRSLERAESNLSDARETLREQRRRVEEAEKVALIGVGVSLIPFAGWVLGPALVIGSAIEAVDAHKAIDVAKEELSEVKGQVEKYTDKVSDNKSKIFQTQQNISETDQKLTQIRNNICEVQKQRRSLGELQRKLRGAVHALSVLSGRVMVLEQHTRMFVLQEAVLPVMQEVMNSAEEITRNELLCNGEMLRLVAKMKQNDTHLRAVCASANSSSLQNYF